MEISSNYFWGILLLSSVLFSCKKDCLKPVIKAHIPLCDTIKDLNEIHLTFPNTAKDYFTIKYELPDTAFVKASLYNRWGDEKLIMINEIEVGGSYEKVVLLDSTFTSGVYVISFNLCNKRISKAITIIR